MCSRHLLVAFRPATYLCHHLRRRVMEVGRACLERILPEEFRSREFKFLWV
jgi:hypothetical protein